MYIFNTIAVNLKPISNFPFSFLIFNFFFQYLNKKVMFYQHSHLFNFFKIFQVCITSTSLSKIVKKKSFRKQYRLGKVKIGVARPLKFTRNKTFLGDIKRQTPIKMNEQEMALSLEKRRIRVMSLYLKKKKNILQLFVFMACSRPLFGYFLTYEP